MSPTEVYILRALKYFLFPTAYPKKNSLGCWGPTHNEVYH